MLGTRTECVESFQREYKGQSWRKVRMDNIWMSAEAEMTKMDAVLVTEFAINQTTTDETQYLSVRIQCSKKCISKEPFKLGLDLQRQQPRIVPT